MRVLHVIPFLWSGAGRVLTDLCAAQTLHHNVAIVTSDKSKGMADWPSYRRQLSAAGVRHHLIDFFDRDAAVYWNGVEKLGALISEWRPDVVHCHSGVPACAVAVIRDRRKNDFRFIAQLHSWGLDRPAWMNTMDLWGFSRADCVIANAGSYRKILMD